MITTHRHKGVVCEDDRDVRDRICNVVASLDHEPIPLGSLQEIKQFLEKEEDPCYWLQDMQMPHVANAVVHEKVGETSMRLARARSRGPFGWPILVVTGFRSDSAFVMSCARAEADEFIEKADIDVLADKILEWLRLKGRPDHASCPACNVRSRPARVEPAEAPRVIVARLYSHEQQVGAKDLTQLDVDALIARRTELHMFVNALFEESEGWRAGRTDVDGKYREVFLQTSQTEILVELVSRRKAVRPCEMACFKKRNLGGSPAAAIRLVEQARKLVDVNPVIHGRTSRRKWRAIHTLSESDMKTFWFDPGPAVRWGVLAGP
jgi:FixJ family two-component response regulator